MSVRGDVGQATRCGPGPVARALDLSGICGGSEFIGPGPDAVRRVRRIAAILRGDFLKYGEVCRRRAMSGRPAPAGGAVPRTGQLAQSHRRKDPH